MGLTVTVVDILVFGAGALGWGSFGEASVPVNTICQVWWVKEHFEGALVLAKGAHLECLVVEPFERGSSLVVGLDRASLQGSTGTD